MTTPDFVDVQLSDAGKRAAGDGPLAVANAHFNYEFRAGATVRVTRRYEWEKVLSLLAIDGATLLEIAPEKSTSPTKPEVKNSVPIAQGAEDGSISESK